MGLLKKLRERKNKKLMRDTIYDVLILGIIGTIIVIILHLLLKSFILPNSKEISGLSESIKVANKSILYLEIISVVMFIISFITITITTIDQVKAKNITRNNCKKYKLFVVLLTIAVNTLIGFIISLIINNLLIKLCNLCNTTSLSYYTYQSSHFNKAILMLCINYVLWSVITIVITNILLNKYRKKKY